MFRFTNPASWTFHRAGTNHGGLALTLPPVPGVRMPSPLWKRYPKVPVVDLPIIDPPRQPLGEALAERISCRQFTAAPLEHSEVAALLRASYGVFGTFKIQGFQTFERPVPSGGACYPIELYLLVHRVAGLEPTVYHYAPSNHRLEQLRGPLPWPAVAGLFGDQPYLGEAGLIVMLTGVVHRTLTRYGDRGFRFVWIEAGHVAQNLNLVGAAMGLGTLNLGGFFDDPLAALLGVDPEVEIPLYGVAVGRPATSDREGVRNPV